MSGLDCFQSAMALIGCKAAVVVAVTIDTFGILCGGVGNEGLPGGQRLPPCAPGGRLL